MAQGSLAAALAGELRKFPNLDPNAVMAIAQHEGLSGGVGDNGTSFGPFQLHKGGALPGNIPLQSAQQWAWSPQGIDYALSKISSVAGGLKGLPAIEAISTRFERPANPQAEIQDAAHHYGGPLPNTMPNSGGTVPAAAPGGSRLVDALKSTFQAVGLGTSISPLLAALGTPSGGGGKAGQGQAGLPGPAPTGNGLGQLKFEGNVAGEQPAFLGTLAQAAKAAGATAIRVNSGYRDPQHNAQVGGVQGSLHTQGKALDGEALIRGQWVPLGVALKPVAPRFGLRSGDVPGFFNGRPDPAHVDAGYGR